MSMRIAMIVEAWKPIWGGGQVHALELAKKLVTNHACEVDIFTMNLAQGAGGSVESPLPGLRIIRVGKKRRFSSSLDRICWSFEAIASIRERHRVCPYGVIHAHATLPGITGKFISIVLRRPVVYTVHGSHLLDQRKKELSTLGEWILFTKIKYDKEITVSRKLFDYSNINTPVVIPNGVDIRTFENPQKKGLSPSPQFLFVGRLLRVKGVDLLFEALARLEHTGTLVVHIVGKGPEEKRLKELSAQLNIGRFVRFHGALYDEDLVRMYHSADWFVLPSRTEGFPLTILEALSARVPVIATDVGDISDIVTHGKNGFIASPNDAESLSEALTLALNTNPQKYAQMEEDGYQLIKTGYTWDSVARKTYDIYSTLA